MTITFTGDSLGSTERILTQCHSMDLALSDGQGNVGFPLKSIVEVYANKGVGKTTFCLSMMGMIAKQLQKNIVLLDWEGQSRETIEGVLNGQQFFGNVEYILNRAEESSEDTVERFLLAINGDEQNVGLVDSIGGFLPTAYLEGQISDSSMGVFARETGRMVNKAKQIILQTSPGAIFMTNHIHPTIGGMVQGQDTAGGVKKKYLSHVRLDLKRAYIGNSTISFGDSWLIKGKVDDNRYGFSKREFYVYMIGGEGIHVGLTALWDCVVSGLAALSSKAVRESTTVNMDGTNYGKLGNIVKHRNEQDFFTPFINALRSENVETPVEDEEVEEEPKKGKRK